MPVTAASLELVAASSEVMVTWALAIAAGSVAAIVSTSYVRPQSRKARSIYLLFLPGWILLGVSIYFGNSITRNILAAQFVNESRIPEIAAEVNSSFIMQQSALGWALTVFSAWLLLYLAWWIFAGMPTDKSTRKS